MAELEQNQLFTRDEDFILKSGSTPRCTVEKKVDGLRLCIFYSDGKVKAFTDSGSWVEGSLPDLVNEIKKTKHPVSEFAWDCELELWRDGKHRPREEIAALLHRREKISGKSITLNVFDCLVFGDKDIHKLLLHERREYLEKFSFKQCTMGVPSADTILNLLPSEYCETLKEVESAIRKCLRSPGAEGVMLKLTHWKSSDYSLTGMTNSWIKQKKYASVHCLVGKVNETKVGEKTWNYELFLRFRPSDSISEKTIKEIKGKEYTHIGRSYNSSIKAQIGSIITISFHAMNLYVDPETHQQRLHLYEPILRELFVGGKDPDYFSTAIKIGQDSGLLIEKTFTKALDLLYKVPAEQMKSFVPEYRRGVEHDSGILEMETVPEELRKGRFVWFAVDEPEEDTGEIDRKLGIEKMKIGGFELTNKDVSELEIGEGTYPRKGGRLRGVSVGRDKDGYFIFTHRARSKSYPTVKDIPDKVVQWIESTG